MPSARLSGLGRFGTSILLISVAGVVALAACSSSKSTNASASGADSGGATSGGATSAGTSSAGDCVSKANAAVQPYINLPTTLPVGFTPLSKKPAPGSLIFLAGIVPSDQFDAGTMMDAARAIGWTATKINFDGSVEDLNDKFEQAISEKPTVINLAGYPTATIQKPLAEAKAAGIYVGLNSIAAQPTSAPGFAALSNSLQSSAKAGTLNAEILMWESNCKANVAVVTIAGFPTLVSSVTAFTSTLKNSCPECSSSVITLQGEDLGTPAATTQMFRSCNLRPRSNTSTRLSVAR